MKHRSGWSLLAAGLCLAAALNWGAAAPAQSIPAFSGAEGPGSTATGGRGGDVYHVTNLEFDLDGVIPGSLKYGINTAPAAGRTIVFDVGGTIYHNGGGSQWWFRSSKSNITVAGQTAPGGITIAGVGSKWTGDNIILRNITVRPNKDPVNPTGFTYDGVSTQATNSIIDHVSVTWAGDEGISATDAVNNTTVQYSLIGEGLNFNGHSYGSILNTQVSNAPMAYHHNVYAHNNSRNPRVGSETGAGAIANFYNNTIYNWVSRAGYSALNADTSAQEPSRTNFVGNFYLRGANNGSTVFLGAGDQTQIYNSGNLYDGNRDGDFNDGAVVTDAQFTGTRTIVASPFSVAGGVIDSATMGRDRSLDYAGTNWWARHPIDARVINSVRTGTGAIINDLTTGAQAAEWATVLSQQTIDPTRQRLANWDADGDGMPGDWELAHGLNPSIADHNGDLDGDGYRNVEEYINEIAEWPAPAPIVFNGATNNRYAQITNWNIKWQPSKFDEAQINAGTVVVDAVGQHAKTLKIATSSSDVAQLNVTSGWLVAATSVVIGATPTAQGTLNLSGGALVTPTLTKGDAGAVNFTGGMLSAGTVTFDLVNNGGAISPGASPGSTRVMGDLTINSGSLLLELAGDGGGQYDRVIVDDALTAGGTLEVSLLNGFAPALDDSFDLLDFASVSGSFSVSLPALGPGLAWDASDLLVTGELRVTDADFEGDHDVDGGDFLQWQRGAADSTGLSLWEAAFGSSVIAAPVPEPSALLMTALMWAAAAALKRRDRNAT